MRDQITAAVETSTPPRAAALEIVGRINRATGQREGGVIGLTSQQAAYVRNMRAELARIHLEDQFQIEGDSLKIIRNPGQNYFTRAKRDRRFDGLVRAAMEGGKPVSKADIDRIAGRYADRLLKLRGDTIARTEAINAMRAGQHEGFRQLVDSGRVRDDQIERTWSATPDLATRHDHVAMNGTKLRGMGKLWQLPDGSVMEFPGDTSHGAKASEVINCRCTEKYRIRYE